MNILNDSEKLTLLYEAMTLRRTGLKTIARKDVSNFLYQITDGGRELCTIHTFRKNTSKTDSKKIAGMPMRVTGRLGACEASHKAARTRNPNQDEPVQYQRNNVLKMCVTSVDGEEYVKKYPAKNRTRSFDVTEITKIEAGREEYNIV